MNFLRGILISVGISLVICVVMFLYFQRKYSSMETKVNTLFQLVQEEAIKNEQQRSLIVRENMTSVPQTSGNHSFEQMRNEKIEVSDDESESDSDSDDGSLSGIHSVIDMKAGTSQFDQESDDDNSESDIDSDADLDDTDDEQEEIHVKKIHIDVEEEQQTETVVTNNVIDMIPANGETNDEKNIQYLEENYKKMPVQKLRETIKLLDLPIMGNLNKIKKKELIKFVESYINDNNSSNINETTEETALEKKSFNVSELLLEASQTPNNTSYSEEIIENGVNVEEQFSELIAESVHSQDEESDNNEQEETNMENFHLEDIESDETKNDISQQEQTTENAHTDTDSVGGSLIDELDDMEEVDNLD
jgi:hypothetical protein